jgi:lantibiotic modifying enzyme
MTDLNRKERLLEGAVVVGDALCASAIWHGDWCNWMGRASEEMDADTRIITPMARALDGDFYGGSAGVAMFLAQLAATTRAEPHRRTAVGAARRSLARAAAPSPDQVGFHSGLLGIAYACARVGWLLGDGALVREGVALAEAELAAIRSRGQAALMLDVIGGCAGAILALLAMRQASGTSALLDGAVALGEHLLDRAVRDGLSYKWPESMDQSGEGDDRVAQPLTGYSHGAAGIGLALLELFAVTGDQRFRSAGLGAFTYENTWFSKEHGNWPDLRSWALETTAEGQMPYGLSWCHGAPGIGLARLRALSLVPEARDSLLGDARVALATTRAELAKHAVSRHGDVTPCHGIAGLAELVLCAGTTLDEPGYRAEAEEIGLALIDLWRRAGTWISGTPSGGPNPSFMIGTAGAAYFLLRVCDPTHVPSALVPSHW